MKKGIPLISKLSLPELFHYLESKRKWFHYYFDIENDFDISAKIGQQPKNMHKNRYCNVWPWDKNRVELHSGGYINASVVSSPAAGKHYICTQEPLNGPYSTKDDFWQMIWQSGCSVIIMLNDPNENNSYHSPEYYPYYPTGVHNYTQYTSPTENTNVKLVSRDDHSSFIVSKLQLSVNCTEPREVTHLQFRGWKDYEIPSSAVEFYSFLTIARTHFDDSNTPPVVHCSAGVGRTGTFVLADVVLKMVSRQKTIHVDLQAVLTKIREERMWLVQTPEQLRFCLQTILQGLNDTKMPPS